MSKKYFVTTLIAIAILSIGFGVSRRDTSPAKEANVVQKAAETADPRNHLVGVPDGNGQMFYETDGEPPKGFLETYVPVEEISDSRSPRIGFNTAGAAGSGGLPSCLQSMKTKPRLADYVTYMSANSNVVRAMNPCKLPSGILAQFITKLEESETTNDAPSAPLPAAFDPGQEYVGLGAQSDEINGAKLAHIFWLEVRGKVPWRLASYSDSELKWIFSLCKLPSPCGRNKATVSIYTYVLDHSPQVAWHLIQQKTDVTALTNQKQALTELVKHMREFIHGGYYYDLNGNLTSSTATGTRTLDQMAGEKISRHGCWSTTAYAIALGAALNIPVDGIYGYYATPGGHATFLSPYSDQVLAHGDDPYSALFDATPARLVYDTYTRWKNEVLNYNSQDSRGVYNSRKHEREMYRTYPSAYFMGNYCQRPAGERRAYLESIINQGGTYATPEQLNDLEMRITQTTNNCSVIPPDPPYATN